MVLSMFERIVLFIIMLAHLIVEAVKRVRIYITLQCKHILNKAVDVAVYVCEGLSKQLYNLSLTLKKHVKVQK